MYQPQVIRIRCKDGYYARTALAHPCGLSYHQQGQEYVVTHLATGKLVLENSLATERQVRGWIRLLRPLCDWWYLDIGEDLEDAIYNAWKKARNL